MSSAVSDLLSILDLEQLDLNLFRGRSPQVGWQRVFGGQVIGQALVAAVRTVEGRRHVCRLEPGPLEDATAWLRFYERHWTARLDALTALFEEEQ